MRENEADPLPERAAFIESVITQISEKEIRAHLEAVVGIRHPVTAPEGLRAAKEYIAEQMKLSGLDLLEEVIEGGQDEQFVNLIGRMDGGGRTEKKILLIGAHYDTVPHSPGADDNASGLAVLLEVARVLASLRGKMTLQFVAFSLEEEGFLGSDHYVRQVRRNKVPLWGAIILECVGYTNQRPGSQQVPAGLPIPLPDQGDFIGLVGNTPAEPIQKAYEAAVAAYASPLRCVSLLLPGKGEALPDARRSDHVPFWDRGYRAVMLTDTANLRNPHYHRETDQIETLDLSFITQVARALVAAVIDLAELNRVKENS
ncbi:MAG: M20/M25/M40 family metallo-hydrolase [Candidatus Manganitrophaceae bacterium]